MDTFTKMFSTIAGVVVATSISSYYIWQFILDVPFLHSVLAVATTITIVLAEIIFILWFASYVRHKHRMSDAMYRGALEELSSRNNPRQIR